VKQLLTSWYFWAVLMFVGGWLKFIFMCAVASMAPPTEADSQRYAFYFRFFNKISVNPPTLESAGIRFPKP
jgi:hypothetical protein